MGAPKILKDALARQVRSDDVMDRAATNLTRRRKLLMSTDGSQPAVRVRRRHAWTIMFRADVTEEIAEQFVSTGRADFGQKWLDQVQIVGPLCFHCEQDFDGSSWACPGEEAPVALQK